ncbi:RagB/SusD family nutrient uptake outer membrane protein [Chitinophaga rhizosphaerae]|uniref:RagB/SusD family nutrient uptake outer membrane protein n=1 Tax=Chitinophaga rhizosphaerae TaxID=1864947 RepID=UPI000F808922|nr:RagB/SusD family nutrient uptake outer membrane protein [Chitinophaga rhizosphaerae]
MKRISLLIIFAATLTASCNKYLDTPTPKTEVGDEKVFATDQNATSAVTGIYISMNSLNYLWANVMMNFLAGIHGDDVYYASNFEDYDVFKQARLLPNSTYVERFWNAIYSYIYTANACVEGLTASTTLTPALKDQLLGEARFMRAYFYFYLVNMYGDVPLVLTTDYRVSEKLPREKTEKVYDQVVEDLRAAKQLLGDNYPNGNRVRPNKTAASAMLARVYLYRHEWALAETEASAVIGNGNYELLKDLNSVFLANSREAIFQLQSVNVGGGRNTWEAQVAIPANATAGPLFRLDTINLIRKFETGDARLANWTGTRTLASGATYFWPAKYKVRNATPVQENTMLLRMGEQFLIRAEARIRQHKLDDGRSDLDSIRLRANLPKLNTALTQPQLLQAVESERKFELFAEWGHRWFDLKRTQRSTDVLGPIKGAEWQPTDTLYPIPAYAISTNLNLTQNEGYKK